MKSASRAHREGRLEEALRVAQSILAVRPGDLPALLLAGVVATKMRRFDIAIPALTQVGEQDPSAYNAFYWLSTSQRWAGNLPAARTAAEKAVALNRKEPQAHHQLGLCWLGLENYVAAENCFQGAAKLAPDIGPIQLNLGLALEELGRREEAIRAFRRAVSLSPNQIEALYRLGQALALDLDFQGAAEYADRILKLQPDSALGHSLSGIALVGLNRPLEAIEHLAKVLHIEPNNPANLTLYGTVLQAAGRMEEADQVLQRSIEADPRQGYPYYALVRTHKIGEADQLLVEKMESVATDSHLSRRHRGDLEYALGKVAADRGDFEAAMNHFDQANGIVRERNFGKASFDARHFAEGTDFAIRNIDETFLDKYRGVGSESDVPIFVVGMIRSGTTLAEQILSSHPLIGAAGEQRFWMDHRGTALKPPGNTLDSKRLRQLTDKYLEVLREVSPGYALVVDKMPGNFAHLGMIHVAFPNARIIHMRRNPVDTCLSIWSTPNSSILEWANVKANVVFAYRDYLRVMEHWRKVIPANRLLEIDYEELVTDAQGLSRNLIDFCGLEWSDLCLRPDQNTRAVATPSNWQVRQPIYRHAVERWRAYEPWLGEFQALLEP